VDSEKAAIEDAGIEMLFLAKRGNLVGVLAISNKKVEHSLEDIQLCEAL
jgi:hypothetical protein